MSHPNRILRPADTRGMPAIATAATSAATKPAAATKQAPMVTVEGEGATKPSACARNKGAGAAAAGTLPGGVRDGSFQADLRGMVAASAKICPLCVCSTQGMTSAWAVE